MTNQEQNRKIAELEFINDQLTSELSYIQNLLVSIGFSEGLTSLKEAAQEMLQEIE